MYASTPRELAPEEDQGVLLSLIKTPQVGNLDYTEKATQKLYTEARTVPEVLHTFVINGFPSVRAGFAGFILKPWGERARNEKEVLAELGPKFLAVPTAQVQAFSPPALPGSTGGPPMQFVIRTTGDYATLADVALKMQQAARESGLFLFTDVDLKFDTPQYVFKVDADKANRIGVNMADVGTALATMLGGNYVNLFNLEGRSYQVIPQAPREFRLTPEWLTRYQLRTSNGELVPLSAVASVTEQVQPNALTSFQQLNSATLSGVPFPGRTLGEALDFLKAKSKEIFPEGYSYDFQGDLRQYEQEGNVLVYVFVFALIVIYLVLAAQYESFRDPLIILVALPTALFGALLPLNIGGFLGFASINIYSQIGLVTLIGLISKHGILMVDFANRLQETGGPAAAQGDRGGGGGAPATDPDDHGGDGGRHDSADHGLRRRREIALHHRRHDFRRDGDRHAFHPVRDADGLHLPRPRPCGAHGQRAGGGASRASRGGDVEGLRDSIANRAFSIGCCAISIFPWRRPWWALRRPARPTMSHDGQFLRDPPFDFSDHPFSLLDPSF